MNANARDIYWAVAMAAILAAWFVTHQRLADENAELQDANAKLQALAAETTSELTTLATELVQPPTPIAPHHAPPKP